MLRMKPSSPFTKCGITALPVRKTPLRFVSTRRSQSETAFSIVSSKGSVEVHTPAFATTISRPGNSSTTSLVNVKTWDASLTSTTAAFTSLFVALAISLAISCMSVWISQSATLAPHSASLFAIPYPIPDAAPVIKAVFPDKSIIQTSRFLYV